MNDICAAEKLGQLNLGGVVTRNYDAHFISLHKYLQE